MAMLPACLEVDETEDAYHRLDFDKINVFSQH